MKTNKHTLQKLTLACILVTSFTSVAQANNTGFYFGAGVSQTNLEANQQNMSVAYGTDPDSSFETNGLGLSLIAGITLDEYLSFEVTYTGLGSIALDDGTTQQKMFDADLFNLAAVLSHPISDKVDIFGKLGVSYWSTLDEDVDTLVSGSGIVYGAGFDINIYGNKNRTMRIEWQRQEFENITFESADTITASAIFKF